MRSNLSLFLFVSFLPGLLGDGLAQSLSPWPSASLASPDGKIQVTIVLKEKLDPYPPGTRVYYSIQYQGVPVLLDSPLGLDFKEMPPIARDLRILGESRESIQETWTAVVGKRKLVPNRANQLRLELEESGGMKRRLDMIFRASDDGVALRYFLPEQAAFKEFRLTSERTEFHFASNHTIWAAQYGTYRSSQEKEFDKITLEQVTSKSILGLPLLIQASDSCFAAITEANLTDWAGMYLTGAGSDPYALSTTLSPRPDEPGVLVRSQTPRASPWRVILLGPTGGSLIESNLIVNLNEPCALRDTSWIKPGRSAWDRWWSGSYAPDAGFPFGMNTASMNYFTQFAADMGWEYVLVDWTWYGEPLDPNADITKSIPEVDLPAIIKFAHDRNVKVIIWLRWNHVNRQLEQAFPLYEKWGVSGVKVDFMDSDDQEMVNFYHRVIKKAAEHHLLVDFHGAYKPTGLQRTYPNYITQEGVMGNEYNKWSSRVTPEHNVTLPFTRMLAGPMDFTPGGFRHLRKATFKSQDVAPFVMGTRAHQLAMMVVYESPLQVLCDSPYNYRNQPGLEFLKIVPTNWDETRVVNGQVGEFITVARKSGDRWFLGGMTNSQGRRLEIPLTFLGEGRYQAAIYSDNPDSADFPERIKFETKALTSKESLKMNLAPEGGFAIALIPEK